MPEQRDLLLIPVPFTDLTSQKRRPVVVLSSTSHNRRGDDFIVAAVTSNIAGSPEGVVITSLDMAQGTLPVQSIVRADKVYTLNQKLIIKHLGRLRQEVFSEVLKCLDGVLGREPRTT